MVEVEKIFNLPFVVGLVCGIESPMMPYPKACGELSIIIVFDKSRPKMVKSLI